MRPSEISAVEISKTRAFATVDIGYRLVEDVYQMLVPWSVKYSLYLVCFSKEYNGLLLAFPDTFDQFDMPISRPSQRM